MTQFVDGNSSGCAQFDSCFKCTYEYDYAEDKEPLVSSFDRELKLTDHSRIVDSAIPKETMAQSQAHAWPGKWTIKMKWYQKKAVVQLVVQKTEHLLPSIALQSTLPWS